MDLILHCGDIKTGSTSIQKALWHNRPELSRSHILYHTGPFFTNHNHLRYLAGVKGKVPRGLHSYFTKRAMGTARKLARKAKRSQAQYVLISSELFFTLSQPQIDEVLKSLKLEFQNVYSIIYLRCPVKRYTSVLQEEVKTSNNIIDPNVYKKDYYSPVTTWRNYVGGNHLLLDTYERAVRENGCIVEDFIQKLRSITRATLDFKPVPSVNSSMNTEQALALYEFRANHLQGYDDSILATTHNITRLFSKLNARGWLPGTKLDIRDHYKYIAYYTNRHNIRSLEEAVGFTFSEFFYSPSEKDVARDHSRIRHLEQILSAKDEETAEAYARLLEPTMKGIVGNAFHFLFRNRQTKGNLGFLATFLAHHMAGKACMAADFILHASRNSALFRALRKIGTRTANDPEDHYKYGLVQLNEGELAKAADSFQRALDIDPTHRKSLHGLGMTFLQQGAFKKAERIIITALKLDRDDAEAHHIHGRILLGMQDLDRAAAAQQRAVALAPEMDAAHLELKKIYTRKKEPEKALAAIRTAIRLQPMNFIYPFHLGSLLLGMKDVDGAEAAFRSSCSINPRFSRPHYQLAKIYQSAGETDKAIAEMRKALYLKENCALYRGTLGALLMKKHDRQAAAAALRTAARLDPENKLYVQQLATITQKAAK